ncbi:MAG: hypothetical protein ACXV8U_23590 [Methylobacter sp.]
MTHFIQEITSKINALPESMQQEVLAFIEIMHLKAARQALASKHEPVLFSEQADWNRPEEDDAWVSY